MAPLAVVESVLIRDRLKTTPIEGTECGSGIQIVLCGCKSCYLFLEQVEAGLQILMWPGGL